VKKLAKTLNGGEQQQGKVLNLRGLLEEAGLAYQAEEQPLSNHSNLKLYCVRLWGHNQWNCLV